MSYGLRVMSYERLLLKQGSTLSCLYRQVQPVKIEGTRSELRPKKNN